MKIHLQYIVNSLMLFVVGLCWQNVEAQVLPPDIQCMRNDTIFWTQTPNNCGPFEAYELYYGVNFQGPFTLLGRFTDPNTLAYYHPNPGFETRFYYMLSQHTCPGEISISSDTMSNQTPDLAVIRSVSVINDDVLIEWYPSNSAQVDAYIIYRNTISGLIPIDTVYNQLTYLDTQANPRSQSETYYILSLDPCGNTSLFDAPHKSILLDATSLVCEQNISLSWNAYENWPDGVGYYEIWNVTDAAAPLMLGTVADSVLSYQVENTEDLSNYCFEVVAISDSLNNRSTSSTICLNTDFVLPMRYISIENVTVNADNEIELSWCWDSLAEIQSAFIDFGMNDSLLNQSSGFPLNNSLSTANNYTFSNINPESALWNFKVNSVDDCDSLMSSPIAHGIFLNGYLQNNQAVLNWNEPNLPDATPIEYLVYQIKTTGDEVVGRLNPSTQNFTSEPFLEANSLTHCFYIVARSVYTKPDGSTYEIRTRSNTQCVEQTLEYFMPNAFAPLGKNSVFKPVGLYSPDIQFEMLIFDRWGKNIFSTNNFDEGWNGMINETKLAPAGVYQYLIKIQTNTGQVFEKADWLMLVR